MIKGSKVFLRAVEYEDTRLLSAWFNDRETNKFLDILYPLSKRYIDDFITDYENSQNKKIFIIDSREIKSIGVAVIERIKWEHGNCEIGIAIYDRNYRGKGYGRDALDTLTNFIFNEMRMHVVYLNVSEENSTAIKLYKAAGFETEGILRERYYKDGKYHNIITMSKVNKGGI